MSKRLVTDSEIRTLIVADRERLQRLMLTDQESEVLHHFTSYKTFSSFQVSAVFCFKPSHTSMVIRKLLDKGYISRRTTSHSGGTRYEYRATR